MRKLDGTERVVQALVRLQKRNYGAPVTTRDLTGKSTGFRSNNTVWRYLNEAIALGLVHQVGAVGFVADISLFAKCPMCGHNKI